MEKTVKIAEGTEVAVKGLKVNVKGERGELEKDFSSPIFSKLITIEKVDDKVVVKSKSDKRKVKAEVGCIAAHIRNMIKGVKDGWKYKLKIVYVHFPMTVKVSGDEVHITNFLGEKFPRKARILEGTKVEIKGDEITVTGTDIEKAGQTATNIEQATKVPARDRRVFQDGCFLVGRS
ncbi:MAG: 50S ribosomal protein L6 [Candidatus Aenigmatarchaeota archaeon]